jgi:hypothetical protein
VATFFLFKFFFFYLPSSYRIVEGMTLKQAIPKVCGMANALIFNPSVFQSMLCD